MVFCDRENFRYICRFSSLHEDAEIKTCDSCHAETKATFPSGMQGKLQYGNDLKTYAINLIACQVVALNRVQKCFKAMIGQTISETTLLKLVLRLNEALEAWEMAAVDELPNSSACHVDEASLRVDKKNDWIHVYSSGDITLKKLQRKRGKEAIDDINIIPRYGGTIIHDCWASYLSYVHCGHGLCGSHLLRELTFIIDSNDYLWAVKIKKLLQETCKKDAKSKRKRLTKNAYKKLQQQYRTIMTQGKKELPDISEKPNGKCGKMAKLYVHNLWVRLNTYDEAVLLFAKESHVAFTNNRADRVLCMAKVK